MSPPLANRGTLQQVAGPGRRLAVLPDPADWERHLALLARRAARLTGAEAADLHHQRAGILARALADPLGASAAWEAALAADPGFAPARMAAAEHALSLDDQPRLAALLATGPADEAEAALLASLWLLRWPEPSRAARAVAALGAGPVSLGLAQLALDPGELRAWLEARALKLSGAGHELLAAARLDGGAPAGSALSALAPERLFAAWLAVEGATDPASEVQALEVLADHCDPAEAGALWFLAAERQASEARYARAAGGSLDTVIALQRILRARRSPGFTAALAAAARGEGALAPCLALRAAQRLLAAGDLEGAETLALGAWSALPGLAEPIMAQIATRSGQAGALAERLAERPPADPFGRFLRAALAEHVRTDASAARAALGAPASLQGDLPALRAAQRLAPPGDCRALQIEARQAPQARQLDLYLQIAWIYLTRPDSLDKALTYLFWILDARPEHPTALRLLVQACRAADRLGPLAEALGRWLALVDEPSERAAGLQALAEVNARTGQDPGLVADLLSEAAALAPDDGLLGAELERALGAAQRFEALAARYQRRRATTPKGPDRAALGLRLGLLLEGRLGDEAGARAVLSEALAEDPPPPVAARLAAALDRLRGADTEDHTLTDLLGAPETDVPLTDTRAGATPSAASELEALLQAPALPILAPPTPLPRIERGGAPPPPPALPEGPSPPADGDALSAFLGAELSRPAGVDPARAAVRRRLLQDRGRGPAWPTYGAPPLVQAAAALEAADEPDARFAAAEALALAYEAHGAKAEAARAWRTALGWRAGAPRAEAHLEALVRASEDPRGLADLLAGRAQRAADLAKRRALWIEVARLHAGPLADPGAAVDPWREALASGPPDPALVDALAEALRAARRWPEYLELRQRTGRDQPDPTDPERTLALGRVHLYARRDAAAALPFVVAAARALPDRVDVAADVAEARAALGQIEAAVSLLEQCLSGLVGPAWAAQRAELAGRLARLLEGPGADPDRARAAWRAAIEAGARDPAILDRCDRLAIQAQDWATLAVVLQASLEEATTREAPVAERRALAVRLAHVLAHRLDQARAAAAVYTEAYLLDPRDGQVFGAARGLVERLGLSALQVRLYRAWLAQAPPDDPEGRGIGLALITALEEAGQPAAAADEAEALASRHPGDPAVSLARQRVLRAAQRWDRLATLYAIDVAAAPDPAIRRERLQQLAQVQESGLRDLEAACESWQAVRTLAPEDPAPLAALARLLEARRDWSALYQVSTAELALTPRPRQRALILFRMGSLLETQLGDPGGAIARYREALEADPRCFPALHGLRDLAARRADWPAVIANLRAELNLWDDPKERAAILARVGEIEAERLADPAAALASFREALALWPESVPAARYLARRAFAEGRYADAAPLWQLLCNQKLDKWPRADRAELFYKRGLTAGKLGRAREAVEALKLALEFAPDHLGALGALIEAAGEPPSDEDRGAIDAALATALEAIPAGPPQARVISLRGRAAELRFDLEAAAADYAQAAELDPDNLEQVTPLVALRVAWRDWAPAAAALRTFSDAHAAAAVEDPAARARCVDALMREGALWTDLAGEPARGVACYQRVSALDPRRLDAAQREAECRVLLGDFAGARQRLGALLASTAPLPAAEHADARFYLGRIEALGFDDPAAAARHYRAALDIDPQHAGARLALLMSLDAQQDPGLAAALEATRPHLVPPPESPAAAALHTFVAGLRLRTGDLAGARALLDPLAAGRGPGFRAARFALVQIHTRAGDAAAARRPLLSLLDEDVTDIDALQTLAEHHQRHRDREGRWQALSVLGLYKALDPAGRAELDLLDLEVQRRRARLTPLGDADLAQHLAHPSLHSPLVQLARLCAPQLAERFPPGPAPDLSAAEQITGRRHPFAARLRPVSALLKTSDFELSFLPDWPLPVGLWPERGLQIVLGRPALEAAPAEQLAHLARALLYCREGLAPLFNLAEPRRLALFRTLDALFVPGAPEQEAARALVESLPDSTAAAVQALIEAHGRMTLPTLYTGEAVLEGISRTADRASLLACGALRPAAEALLRAEAPDLELPEGDDLTWAVRGSARLRDLAKYALSDGHHLARRACDLALGAE